MAAALRWWPPVGLLATLLLGWLVGSGSTPLDSWFTANIRDIVGTQPRWLLAFTSTWLSAAAVAACLTVAIHRRRWRLATAVVVCPVVAVAASAALKRLFDRRNGPYLEYPSGHTTLLVTVMGMLVVVAAGRLWVLACATAVSLLGMIGLIACGYHYFTDTVGAALLATALVGGAARLAHHPAGAGGRRVAIALMAACAGGLGPVGSASAAPEPDVPPVGPQARAAGFVDVRSAVPDAIVDLRYATANNFMGVPLYPAGARCLVHESLAPGLASAAGTLRRQGRTLVFWDCYRPHDVQVEMFERVPDPNWVARPGPFARSHEAGRSVDVTVADPAAQCPAGQRAGGVCLVDMGTDFDDFSTSAQAFATAGISPSAAANRAVLRDAMGAGGLAVYSGEWWHFDGPGAGVHRPILDVPVNS